jgi:hypothetical protein
MKRKRTLIVSITIFFFITILSANNVNAGVAQEKRLEFSLYNKDLKSLQGIKCDFTLPNTPINVMDNCVDYFCVYISIGPGVEAGLSFTKKPTYVDPITGNNENVSNILGRTNEYWREHGYWKQFLNVNGVCSSAVNDSRGIFWSSMPMTPQPTWGSTVNIQLELSKDINIDNKKIHFSVNGVEFQDIICDIADPSTISSYMNEYAGYVRVCQGTDDTSKTVNYEYCTSNNIYVKNIDNKWKLAFDNTRCFVFRGSQDADMLGVRFNGVEIVTNILQHECHSSYIALNSFQTKLIAPVTAAIERFCLSNWEAKRFISEPSTLNDQ